MGVLWTVASFVLPFSVLWTVAGFAGVGVRFVLAPLCGGFAAGYRTVRWTTIERRRRVTRRLVAAFSLGLLALVCFLFAAASEACIYGRGVQHTCEPVTSDPVFALFVGGGTAALAGGLWLCHAALADHHRYGRNGC